MKYYLGLDAGNTKTVAVVANEEGTIVGHGRSGCGDIHGALTPEVALSHVEEALVEALDSAGLHLVDIAAGGFSMAGADWPEDLELLKLQIRNLGVTAPFQVVNDAIGGLRAGTADGIGIAVILGTGAAIGAKGNHDTAWHGGFWLRGVHGDNLVQNVYRAVFDAELGLGPATSLTRCLLDVYGLQSSEDVLHAMTRRRHPQKVDRRLLTSGLLNEFANGDPVAVEIIEEYAKRCSGYALAAALRAKFCADANVPLVFSGGLFRDRHGTKLMDLITAQVHESFPLVVPTASRFEPVIGALSLAYDLNQVPTTKALLAQFRDSMPDECFFQT